jgi:hypothetical protein
VFLAILKDNLEGTKDDVILVDLEDEPAKNCQDVDFNFGRDAVDSDNKL